METSAVDEPTAYDAEETLSISYDDLTPLDSPPPEDELAGPSLANRIGTTKVYLISEATLGASRGKRKRNDEPQEGEEEEEMDQDEDTSHRENAILLQGTPISHLTTTSIFAYATNFDTHPLALEWVDDTTCILVFPTRQSARSAFRCLTKISGEEPSDEGCYAAKSVPVELWPPEDRINKSLGKGEGLKGAIRMRWATDADVKKRGAKNRSEFYKKYGQSAGKERQDANGTSGRDDRQSKRRRGGILDDALERARLDDDLDAIQAEEEDVDTHPHSKMRSDYMPDGKSLLDRTSVLRVHTSTLASRIGSSSPRESYTQESEDARPRYSGDGTRTWASNGRGNRHRDRKQRPKKSQADLDAELDAFLNSRD